MSTLLEMFEEFESKKEESENSLKDTIKSQEHYLEQFNIACQKQIEKEKEFESFVHQINDHVIAQKKKKQISIEKITYPNIVMTTKRVIVNIDEEI